MIGEIVTFDGHRLNDLFYVGRIERGHAGFEPTLVDNMGDGSTVTGVRLGTATVTVLLAAKDVAGRTTRETVSRLLSWLDVDTPRWLTLSGDDGLRRLVVPEGEPTPYDVDREDGVTIAFTQVDPSLYGSSSAATVPSAGSVTFTVGGDYPTRPTITATAAVRNATTGTWELVFDGDTKVAVTLADALQTPVSIDCGTRAVTVDGEVAMITLDSDWPELAAGQHTVAMTRGTGAATVAWTERWHR